MIGNYTKCNSFFTIAVIIFFAGYFFCSCNGAGKNISIIITLLTLNHPY